MLSLVRRGPPLAELLDDVEAVLARYVVFRAPAQRTAVALWCAHAHAIDAAEVTAYLQIQSAEKGAGKTRLLEVLHELTPRPWHAIQPTEAVLFRKIDKTMPTLLLDETDALFAKNGSNDRGEPVRAVLNAGYRRGATVDRVNLKSKNPLESYRVFCVKALAGIGHLPGTVGDRSISIELARRRKDEPIERFFRRDAVALLHPIRDALATWASEAVPALRAARPILPDALPDRAAEVWEPMLAIADAAELYWPGRARGAALALHVGRTDTDSVGVELLRAIRAVFDASGADRLLTVELLRALIEREQEPWPGWWGKDVDQADGSTPRRPARDLAKHLKNFGVQPTTVRTDGGRGWGYKLEDFADPFSRYLSPIQRDTVTSHAAQGFEASRHESGANPNVTPQTVAAQGSSRCHVKTAVAANNGRKGATLDDALAVFPGATVLEREPGCDDEWQ